MTDPTETEMSDFVNQFVPKRTARNNTWAVKIFQTWAIRKYKNPDNQAYNDNELSLELRKFYMDLKQQDWQALHPSFTARYPNLVNLFLKSHIWR